MTRTTPPSASCGCKLASISTQASATKPASVDAALRAVEGRNATQRLPRNGNKTMRPRSSQSSCAIEPRVSTQELRGLRGIARGSRTTSASQGSIDRMFLAVLPISASNTALRPWVPSTTRSALW